MTLTAQEAWTRLLERARQELPEQTFKTWLEPTEPLKLEGDKLSGTVSGRNNMETAIENATYKDGNVSFEVTRERNGQKFTSKYSGKVTGDTLKGKITFTRDGKEQSREFEAKREGAK